jgi:hypothetical protein
MKTINFKWLAIILAMFVLVTDCKKDKEEVSKFVGNFVISNAELDKAFTVPTNESGDFTIQAGTNLTQAIQAALLSAVSCSSPDKSYVELREDNSMYFSCEGSNPLNAGTWDEVSATSLKLNMNSTAVPPIGFVLMVTDIVEEATGLSGMTKVPLTKTMVAGMIAPLQLTLKSSAPEMFLVEISIEFEEK